MNWIYILIILYLVVVILVSLRVIYDTRSYAKSLAYLLIVVFLPVFGILFYFSLGINYRKRKMYTKKIIQNDELAAKLKKDIIKYSGQIYNENKEAVKNNRELAHMLTYDSMSALTADNAVKLLINGEQKFPEVIQVLEAAKSHIHIEYYIYEDDVIGRQIEEILIKKAAEGVKVRFIYDDFGCRSIRKKLVPRLKAGNVQAFPFHKVIFIAFANRINYRNHRKIIVVDGKTAFVGGINVSDRYINKVDDKKKLFWRDTHVRIDGPGVHYLQYLFLSDWNFCAKEELFPTDDFFPPPSDMPVKGNKLVQIAASGPDSSTPTILYSLLQAIHLATEEILITTPYFIPGESIMDALIVSALGGVKVKLLVPAKSDSVLVNSAARSNYEDLLKAGVEIYLYKKGFLHAKTLITDCSIAVVGTANMDYRSFDLNFEVNAIIYDKLLANELRDIFLMDVQDSFQLDREAWIARPLYKQLVERAARLLSPLL